MELIAAKNGREFIFYEKDKAKWKAELLSSVWGQKIAVANLETNTVAAEMSKNLKFIFNANTRITFSDRDTNAILNIPIRLFVTEISFNYNGSHYRFIEHSGLVYSIFKDDKQIGMYKKEHFFTFDKQGLLLKMDSDADITLIISVLSISDLNFYNSDSVATTNVGTLFVSKHPYNSKWKAT